MGEILHDIRFLSRGQLVEAKAADLVADYVGGKDAALNAIFGKCMAEFKGKGNPAAIRPILEGKLKVLRERK